MTEAEFLETLQQVLWMITLLSAPILVSTLVVGVLISILQAVTQIQEATLTFVPKILVSFIVLIFFGPWMVRTLVDQTTVWFDSLIKMAQH